MGHLAIAPSRAAGWSAVFIDHRLRDANLRSARRHRRHLLSARHRHTRRSGYLPQTRFPVLTARLSGKGCDAKSNHQCRSGPVHHSSSLSREPQSALKPSFMQQISADPRCARSSTLSQTLKGPIAFFRKLSGFCGVALRQIQHGIGDAGGQMPHHVFFAGKITGDAAHAELLDSRDIGHDRCGAFGCIAIDRLN